METDQDGETNPERSQDSERATEGGASNLEAAAAMETTEDVASVADDTTAETSQMESSCMEDTDLSQGRLFMGGSFSEPGPQFKREMSLQAESLMLVKELGRMGQCFGEGGGEGSRPLGLLQTRMKEAFWSGTN